MAEINFSSQDTGACPYCRKHNNCVIQDAMTETLADLILDTYDDDEMEVVIYRCPDFKPEQMPNDDD